MTYFTKLPDQKQALSLAILLLTQQFLLDGGKITVCKPGVARG